jgi:hypothetical protein
MRRIIIALLAAFAAAAAVLGGAPANAAQSAAAEGCLGRRRQRGLVRLGSALRPVGRLCSRRAGAGALRVVERQVLHAHEGALPGEPLRLRRVVPLGEALRRHRLGRTAGRRDGHNASYAELWNGTAWSVVSVPPRKGLGTDLLGVSCGSAANCVAVGVASKDGSEETSQAVADVYNGRSWTPRTVPALPRGGTSQFQGVSCVSVSFCAAVGEGGGPGGTLFSGTALTGFWNGKSWTLVTAS